MKIKYMVGIFLVAVLLMGCGTKAPAAPSTPSTPPAETPVTPPVEAPVETTPVETVPPVETAPAAGETSKVSIERTGFIPKELKIAKGTTVTWTNMDKSPHGISAKDKTFFKPRLNANEEYSFTFNEVGTYEYIDIILKSNAGTIIVE